MKFLLISHHTGQEVPEGEREANFKAFGEWLAFLQADAVLPVLGGKTVSSAATEDYRGDIAGALIFEADSIDDAIAKAKRSPGLAYGWTHDVLQEMRM